MSILFISDKPRRSSTSSSNSSSSPSTPSRKPSKYTRLPLKFSNSPRTNSDLGSRTTDKLSSKSSPAVSRLKNLAKLTTPSTTSSPTKKDFAAEKGQGLPMPNLSGPANGPVGNLLKGAVDGSGDLKDASLAIGIKLDLEAEVHLTARVRGDILIGLGCINAQSTMNWMTGGLGAVFLDGNAGKWREKMCA